jgi:hypothetical protein
LSALIENATLPARLQDEHVAKLLNLHPGLVPLLVTKKLLKPLGNPTPKAVRYYHRDEVLALTNDRIALDRITQFVYSYNKARNSTDIETKTSLPSSKPEKQVLYAT